MRIPEMIETATALLDADIPAFVWGKPGIGKSEAIQQIATARGATLCDIRLSMFDPVDLRGLPAAVDGKTVWLKPGIWPVDESRETILFFDEMDRANPSVANAALQIVLDRRIGEHVLPASCRVMAAGNGSTDRVGTTRISSAHANRFCHLDIEPDAAAWRDWANGAGIVPELVAFMHLRPELIHTTAEKGEYAYASPRQWAKLNRLMSQPQDIIRRAAKGLVGVGPAGEFMGFLDLYKDLPRIGDIFANPNGAAVPQSPGARYAVATAVSRAATQQNFAAGITYLDRLPHDYAVVGVVDAVKRDSDLCDTRAYIDWTTRNQSVTI